MAPVSIEHMQWSDRVNAWKWERPVQWVILFAIVSSMGALMSWCFFLKGNDIRSNPLFWMMAVPMMCWYGALRTLSRWAIVSLAPAIVLWPCLALAALLFCLKQARHDIVYHLATPTALTWTFGVALLMAIAAGTALHKSSLPGGAGTMVLRPAGYRPPNALPLPDLPLLSLTKWLLGTLFSWFFVAILSTVAMSDFYPDIDHVIHYDFLPVLGFVVMVITCIVWGQVQSLRTPQRVAPAYVAMIAVESIFCVVRSGWLLLLTYRTDQRLSGVTKLALVGTLIEVGFIAMYYRRLYQRAISYR